MIVVPLEGGILTVFDDVLEAILFDYPESESMLHLLEDAEVAAMPVVKIDSFDDEQGSVTVWGCDGDKVGSIIMQIAGASDFHPC